MTNPVFGSHSMNVCSKKRDPTNSSMVSVLGFYNFDIKLSVNPWATPSSLMKTVSHLLN